MGSEQKRNFSNFQFIFLSVAILIPTALLIFRNQHYFNSHWLEKLQSTSEYYHELLYTTQKHNVDIVNRLAEQDHSVLEVHAKTDDLEEFIEQMKADLINESNGLNDQHTDLADKYNLEGTLKYIVGIGGVQGQGYVLEGRLNEYSDFLTGLSGERYEKIALDGAHDKLYHGEGDHTEEDFVQLNFGKCNLVESLAVLTELQLKVVSYEQHYINSEIVKLFLSESAHPDAQPQMNSVPEADISTVEVTE